jgi:tetratricopeptide (TPR) repeat protein
MLHRDIKPSNLLLDTDGNVWVADFGLAKATGGEDLTHTGDIVGTVRYMAPERFQGTGDARADIYALGITLYEMLALRPAFDESDRAALVRQVTQEDPPRLRRLNESVPADLETIIHKAIAREPAQRYASSAAIREDLERFLDGRPILARRVSLGERAWRWGKRNPAVAGLLGTVAVLLVTGLVASAATAVYFRQIAASEGVARRAADRARAEAVAAQREAETRRHEAEASRADAQTQSKAAEANFARARDAVDEYFTKVSESRLLTVPGLQPLRQDLLRSALSFYEDFVKRRGQDPSLRSALAAVHLKVARVHSELKNTGEAAVWYGKSRSLYESLAAVSSADAAVQDGLAESHLGLGETLTDQSNRDEHLAAAVAIRERLVAAHAADFGFRAGLAWAYRAQGASLLRKNGNVREALAAFLKARDIDASLVRDRPTDPDRQRQFSDSLAQIADCLCILGRHQDETIVRPLAIEHARIAFEKAPQVLSSGRLYAQLCYGQGANLLSQGRYAEGVEFYGRAASLYAVLARENPDASDLVDILTNLYIDGALVPYMVDHTTGDQLPAWLDRGRRDLASLKGPRAQFALARLLAKSSSVPYPGESSEERRARQLKDGEGAVSALKRAAAAGYRDLDALKRHPFVALASRDDFKAFVADLGRSGAGDAAPVSVKDGRTDDDRLRASLAASQHAIGLVQLGLGDRDEAKKSLSEALALRWSLAPGEPETVAMLESLAGNPLAVDMSDTLIPILVKVSEAHPADAQILNKTARVWGALSVASLRAGRAAQAAQARKRADALFEELIRNTPAAVDLLAAWAQDKLNFGELLAQMGNTGEASEEFRKVLTILGNLPETDHAKSRLASDRPSSRNEFGDLHSLRARAHEGLKNRDDAAADWSRACVLLAAKLTKEPANTALAADLLLAYQSAGRTREAIPHLAKAWAANPADTLLSLKVAALQAWFGEEKQLTATWQRMRAFAKDTSDASAAERAAKARSIRASSDIADIEAALVLARRAVELGRGHAYHHYFVMVLGMAEYRSGNYAAAEKTLAWAQQAAPRNPHVPGTSAFYRAMSLFRQGKNDEARKLAVAAAANMKPLPADEQNPPAGRSYQDDLILWMAYKEAKAMIHFDAAGVAPEQTDGK